jgi:S1-C subfamily serine protease
MKIHKSFSERLVSRIAKSGTFVASLIIWTLLLISCQGDVDEDSVSPTVVPTTTRILEQTIPPANTPTISLVHDLTISSLQDVENAVVWVESEGPYFDFKFGHIQNLFGSGSGFIIDPNGLVITDGRIAAGAEKIRVSLGGSSGSYYDADLVAYSECDNFALLKFDGSGLDYLEWEQDRATSGQALYVTSFSADGGEILQKKANVVDELPEGSDANHIIDGAIFYDVEIGALNTGSPVVTPWGKILGVHKSGYLSDQPDYAIPADIVRETFDRLQDDQNLSSIGINGSVVSLEDYEVTGIWISAVIEGSSVEEIGVLPGDVITEIDGAALGSGSGMLDYCEVLAEHSPEDVFDLQIFRPSSGDVYEGQINGRHLRIVDHLARKADLSEEELVGIGGDFIDPGADETGEFYFRTQFIQGLDNWSVFGTEGYEDTAQVSVVGGKLNFFINDLYTYIYYTYDLLELSDVRLEVDTANLGSNNNNVSLICRYSDLGWYEFNVANNGLWWINRFDPVSEFYVELASGGSFDINMGQKRNQYTAICDGEQLTLFANGVELSTVTDKILSTGNVGFSFSSANISPVVGELEYFEVSVP